MKKKNFSILFFLTSLSFCFSDKPFFLNRYYYYPYSLSLECQLLTNFDQYGKDFTIFEVGSLSRWPIPYIPFLQPALRLGVLNFECKYRDDTQKLNHTDIYALTGLSFSYMFSKNFELGCDLLTGASMSFYPNLIPEKGVLYTGNFLVEFSPKLGLNPIYNLSIEFHPTVKYLYSFSPLTDFNSFIFGLGFSVHFRFGTDPDLNKIVPKSILFKEIKIDPLFAAMQSYYSKNPMGKLVIKNQEKGAVSDLEISFMQQEYMSNPTFCFRIDKLKPEEEKEINLFSAFNENIFQLEGTSTLTGEIIVTYKYREKSFKQTQSVSYELHDKHSIIWDDTRKAAAFITPADSSLINYSSFIGKINHDQPVDPLYYPLLTAMKLYHALEGIQCSYQPDPILPYIKVSNNKYLMDTINIPRQTLIQKSGDCDDLTVLFCTLLECAGIETGFILLPGHIFPVFNTRIPAGYYQKLNTEKNDAINVNGELWVPLEITDLGKSNFMNAWKLGKEEWLKGESNLENRILHLTKEAQKIYRPILLKETDIGLQYGSRENILNHYIKEFNEYKMTIIQHYLNLARQMKHEKNYNDLGIVYAQLGDYSMAKESFAHAFVLNNHYAPAQINLCNMDYYEKNYTGALEKYLEVIKNEALIQSLSENDYVKILLCISSLYHHTGDYENAGKFYQNAVNKNSIIANEYSFLNTNHAGTKNNLASDVEKRLFSFTGE